MKVQVLTPKDNTAKVLSLRHRLYKGMFSRVARNLGVSSSVVARVGKGLKRSRRIENALQTEMRRIERQIEKIVGEDAA